jgi:hypothetical protein
MKLKMRLDARQLPPFPWGSGAAHPTFKYPPGYNYPEAASSSNFYAHYCIYINAHPWTGQFKYLYSNMANPMENNKAVKMLKAAEEGGYGVIGVVSVRTVFNPQCRINTLSHAN